MMKRIPALILTLGLAIALFPGCAAGNPGAAEPAPTAETTVHTHVPSEDWEVNGTEHWQNCECGERIGAEAHALDDEMRCTACGAQITAFGDVVAVDLFNEYGDVIRRTSYDADGNVLDEMGYAFEYDEAGNVLLKQHYEGNRLSSEREYVPAEGGGARLFRAIDYVMGGGWFVTEYDEEERPVRYSSHDDIGIMLSETVYEYAPTADGEGYYFLRETERDLETGVKYVSEYNEQEDQTGFVWYDADGNVTREIHIEREYDGENQPLWQRTYENGALANEIIGYATAQNGWERFPLCVIDHFEDGRRRVAEYDEATGELALEIHYDADGDVVNETRYIYEFDEAGNYAVIEIYENGGLLFRTEYATDENGINHRSKFTKYGEDGEVLSETRYDEEGNAIS